MQTRENARTAALRLLLEVEQGPRPLEEVQEALAGQGLDSRDRRFARQLLLGVLRWQGRLDWVLDHYSRRSVDGLEPTARMLLRLGAYQLLFLDRVPPRAAVHATVEVAKRQAHGGVAALVNAVLRGLQRQPGRVRYPDRQRQPARFLAVYYSHPEWLVERWLQRRDAAKVEAMLVANNEPADLCVRLNPLRPPPAEPLSGLEPAGLLPGYFRVTSSAEEFFASEPFRQGYFQVQDACAGLAAALLDPQPGEQVLDLCSAPGGKATQMAERMQDRGLVLACDRSSDRLTRVRDNARRLGLKSLRFAAQDASAQGSPAFHRVLADVPCSATGVIGRHPDIRWRRRPEELSASAERQAAILRAAFARLRPGGVLVYSTCSLEEEENEQVVERFLAEQSDAELEPAAAFFADVPWADRYVQTLPGRERGDGAFAARIRRNGP